MNRKCPAMTLVEVLAALTLLGTSVVTLLQAQTRSVQALQTAKTRSVAAVIAEELIAEWELTNEDMLAPAEDWIEDHDGWRWQRTAETRLVGDAVEMVEVRLEIVRTTQDNGEVLAVFAWLEVPDEP